MKSPWKCVVVRDNTIAVSTALEPLATLRGEAGIE